MPDVDAPIRTPSVAVVEAVADAKGVDPLDLEPLASVVDPEALDRLFADTRGGTSRTGGRISFVMSGCSVTVTSDGDVSVAPDAESE